ncbi:LOW QUALITY PROTEIN: CCHC-type zinc finger nucleic acid binding protein [Pyrus x bretschneideri]|uniref:LOW QUALITY PROTEIN: CCHC-type zinc finger nucleic acid binding protein n=1 Tax=Pyrus x bretschneideri TaxID=225117 RepID=UPI00202EF151|nr:LOW QUALITY PROTEIN: CCHC-type zinc finger nucleic acid binding protein [Pyrus x bretschneideri]
MKIEDQAVVAKEEEKIEEANAVDLAEAKQPKNVEFTDNVVLRKLFRGPRYFDPPDSSWGACFNCGEEGHAAVNCTVAKRKKPCFVCGSLEHNAKHCRKGQDCFICKKRGHHAKDCPEKKNGGLLKSQICLKCGDSGHDMFSCRNDYSTNDLKEIQCYVCKRFGYLCCVKYVDTSPWEVSYYKCGSMGHTSMACVSLRDEETTGFGTPRLCYKCGEGGHIARECASLVNVHKKFGELPNFSTPVLKRIRK